MPAAEKTVVEIDQPLALTLTGTSIIVTYAGVASNSAYLLPGGIGMKKGPHPKAELQFQQEFPLVSRREDEAGAYGEWRRRVEGACGDVLRLLRY